MSARYTPITQREMEDFLEVDSDTGKPNENSEKNFYRITVPGTKELVYAKKVDTNVSLRVLSSIVPGYGSRDKGEDAIRVVLVWAPDRQTDPKIIGMERIVKRTQNWRDNLAERIDGWHEQVGPDCDCGAPTVRRQKRGSKPGEGYFFGCVLWPNCPGKNKQEVVQEPQKPNVAEYVSIQVSQLHYLIYSALHDSSIKLETLCQAASILYGNKEAFRAKSGAVEMHVGIKKWLPSGEK